MIKKMSVYYFFLIACLHASYFYASCKQQCTTKHPCATIEVGDTPGAIAITPDGRFAYVANSNNDGLTYGNTVTVIDLETNCVETTISDPSFNLPYTVTINKDGTKVYITNSGGYTVSIIDSTTNTVTGLISGFDGPSGFAITPDGKTAYVNNYGTYPGAGSGFATTVNEVDLNTNMITDTIMVDLAPAALAITPDGKFVYVANYVTGNPGTGTISVIDTSNNTVVDRIKGLFGPFGIVITPDGRFAYVTNFGSNNFSPLSGGMSPQVSGSTVSVVDLCSNTIVATIPLGNQPAGIAITPNGRFVYVSNYNTFYLGANYTNLTAGVGTVNIIDTCTNCVLCPVLMTGKSPSAIAISPCGDRAYVTNYTSNDVNVFTIFDRMWLNVCK